MSLRERLRNVADDPALAFDGTQPVRLHRGAIPERAIAIMAPGDSSDILGDAAPSAMRVFYTRLRVAPQTPLQRQDMADHYETRTKGFKRLVGQSTLWYDGVRRNSNGTRMTMDVVIEQAGAPQGGGGFSGGLSGEGGGNNSAAQYVIEIIVVETRDPKDPPAAADVAAAAATN
ncbi:MAG TPA: hypothetical protein EYQ63_19030 [Fuerstia sp.]|nr:hypothetical protein [Fuerstiella sp.]